MYGSRYWTSGFWPGACGRRRRSRRRRRVCSLGADVRPSRISGSERADTHDVGFMYGESSLAAWNALCRGRRSPRRPARGCGGACWPRRMSCSRWRRAIRGWARSRRTPPASRRGHDHRQHDEHRDFAVGEPRDSATRAYARLASHQAHVVIARLLVRRDGSTAQAVYFDRRPVACFQSGPTRGCQPPAHGRAVRAGRCTGSRRPRPTSMIAGLLRVAAPRRGIRRFASSRRRGSRCGTTTLGRARRSTSQRACITAAGLFHLASACRALTGVCSASRGAGSRSGGGCWRRRSDARAFSPRSASSARRSSTSTVAAAGATEASWSSA